jgi:hypothetical protein
MNEVKADMFPNLLVVPRREPDTAWIACSMPNQEGLSAKVGYSHE